MNIDEGKVRLIEAIDQRSEPYYKCVGLFETEDGIFVVLEPAERLDLTDTESAAKTMDEFGEWADDLLNWFLQDFIVLFNETYGVQYKIEDANDEYVFTMEGDPELAEGEENDRVVFRMYDDSELSDCEPAQPQEHDEQEFQEQPYAAAERRPDESPDQSAVESKYYSMARGMLANMVPDGSFDRTRSYASIHVDIPGVSSLLKQIDDNKQKYHEAKSTFIENNVDELATSLQNVAQLEAKENTLSLVWKIAIGLVVAAIVFAVAMPAFFLTRLLVIVLPLAVLAIPVGFLGAYYFTRKVKGAKKEQEDYLDAIKGKMDWDIARYTSKDSGLFGQVDDRYLASLDPAQREVVFMRRDQERQHQETLKAQQEHQAIIEDEQRRMRKSQEESTRMTKRILDIEEERERERRQNRYW